VAASGAVWPEGTPRDPAEPPTGPQETTKSPAPLGAVAGVWGGAPLSVTATFPTARPCAPF